MLLLLLSAPVVSKFIYKVPWCLKIIAGASATQFENATFIGNEALLDNGGAGGVESDNLFLNEVEAIVLQVLLYRKDSQHRFA